MIFRPKGLGRTPTLPVVTVTPIALFYQFNGYFFALSLLLEILVGTFQDVFVHTY